MVEHAFEGLYEKLVESAGDVIAVLDEQGTIAFVNSRVQHYGGLTVSEAIGRRYTDFLHPDDVERFSDVFERAFKGTPIAGLEIKTILPDSSVNHWVVNGGVTEVAGRRLLMMICRDVTESINLREELVARNNALAALSKIALALSSTDELEEGLAKALDQILNALNSTVGAVLVKGADGKLRISASTAANLVELSADAAAEGTLLSSKCIDTGERIIVPDIHDKAIDPLVQELARRLEVESLISIPLRCGGTTRAALSLAMPRRDGFTSEHMEFLDLVAGILGPAIENATLHRDLTDRVDRLSMLERLARSINSGRDVHTVLNACMSEIAQLVPYDMGAIVLFRADAEADVFPFPENGNLHPTMGMDLDHAQMLRIAHISGPVALSDMGDIAQFHTRTGAFHEVSGSAGIVPLLCMGEKFGLLKVWSREEDRYGEKEMQILEAAAEHLSIAAFNATLYEAEQRKSLELTALAKEARHRIKNNLQMISGLLNVSPGDAESGGKVVKRCLRQVRAISTVHDLLSPDGITSEIGFVECLKKIAENAVQATGRGDSIELSVTGADCSVTSDLATAVGVIVNELVANAVEHGFNGLDKGRIEIRVSNANRFHNIEVVDNGVGLPEGFVLPELSGSATGLVLVSSVAAYGLGGKLEIERKDRGTLARVRVKGV